MHVSPYEQGNIFFQLGRHAFKKISFANGGDSRTISNLWRFPHAKYFFSSSEVMPLEKSVGRICAEKVTFYPPGIPILNLGEKITPQVVSQIRELKNLGGRTLNDANFIKVI